MTATGLCITTTNFVHEHSTIQPNHLLNFAKWLSVLLQTDSVNLYVSSYLWARSSLTFRQPHSVNKSFRYFLHYLLTKIHRWHWWCSCNMKLKRQSWVKLNGNIIFHFCHVSKNQFLVCEELSDCVTKSMTLSNIIIW